MDSTLLLLDGTIREVEGMNVKNPKIKGALYLIIC